MSAATSAMPPVLEARDLVVRHTRRAGFLLQPVVTEALRGVSLALARGEALAVVGESGSGKSTLVRALLRLILPHSGQVLLAGTDLAILSAAELRAERRRAQLVFQDPLASLNPAMTVLQIVEEPLRVAGGGSQAVRCERVVAQLEAVGLNAGYIARRPAQLSGGQAQRVAIARATISQPQVLICDEPVSALDVSLRAQVLDLLAAQCRQHHIALLFVTHDLVAARYLCERTLVLRQGEVVESGATSELFARPRHAYTRQLLDAMLTLDGAARGSARSS